MASAPRIQRNVLGGFLLLVALFAGLAIFGILGGSSLPGGEVLFPSILLTAAAAVLGLISAVVWSKRLWHPIGPIGLLLTVLALAFTLSLFWAWWAWRNVPWAPGFAPWWQSEAAYVCAGILWVLASATCHIALFSLARLKKEYRWILRATILLIISLAGLILLWILDESFRWGWSDDVMLQAIAVLGVLDITGSLAIPIFHRFSVLDKREFAQTVPLELSLTCPRCTLAQTLPVGRSTCARCGLQFVIDIEENVCEKCGYALYRFESAACPECGTPILGSQAIPSS